MYEQLKKLFYKSPDIYNILCESRYSSISSYHLPITISGHDAFYCVTNDMIYLLNKIHENVNKLNNVQRSLPIVACNFCLNSCLIDEIMDTNEIEGVHSSRREITIALKPNTNAVRFKGIARKYSKMAKDNVKYETCKDIRSLYDELVLPEIEEKLRPDGNIFRRDSASVYDNKDRECHIGVNPESAIIEYMEKSLSILNDDNIPILIRTAIFHYLFGYIHPFYDGNGRTSRFISSYIINKTLNPILGFRIAYIVKHNRKTYEKGFDDCNDSKNYGDITPFILMFLDMVNKATVEITDKLKKAQEKLMYFELLMDKLKLDKMQEKVLFIFIQNGLFDNTPLDKYNLIDILAQEVKISMTKLNQILKNLREDLQLPIIDHFEGHRKVYTLDMKLFEQYCTEM